MLYTETLYPFAIRFKREFIGGTLAGLSHVDHIYCESRKAAETMIAGMDGTIVSKPVGGSPYKITGAEIIPNPRNAGA